MILITGGARSGKSDYAETRAADIGGDSVTYVATATAGDDEMAARIARHRADRPAAWCTVEANSSVADAVRHAATDVVLLDCMTMLASNALIRTVGDAGTSTDSDVADACVRAEVDALLAAATEREGTLLIVTNEVGLGIVPATPLGRLFRDALGAANRCLAASADEVILMVSGLPLSIKRGQA